MSSCSFKLICLNDLCEKGSESSPNALIFAGTSAPDITREDINWLTSKARVRTHRPFCIWGSDSIVIMWFSGWLILWHGRQGDFRGLLIAIRWRL